MSDTKLNGRLCSAASFVRQGAVVADIGTDHAYLPIFLLKAGVAARAFALDINEGPLKKADENISAAGLSDKIECRLLDGAAGLFGLGITDYAICGMGGELIADIIERAPHLKDEGVRLILQPMSRQEHLRAYLSKSGFRIFGEAYSSDSGKDYVCFCCEYSGGGSELSDEESYLPASGASLYGREAMLRYFGAKLSALTKAARGKRLGGAEDVPEEKIAERVESFISGIREAGIPDIEAVQSCLN